MRGMLKSTNMVIYVDKEVVGEGEVLYNDMSAFDVPKIVLHCDSTDIMMYSEVVGVVQLCWDDTIAFFLGGAVKKSIRVPVVVGEDVVGEGEITIEDSYSADVISSVLIFCIFLVALPAILQAVEYKQKNVLS